MAQFKIYGHASFLEGRTESISTALHAAAVDALGLPPAKRFHRFLPLLEGYFVTPEDRSDRYLVIECLMFEGRTVETKKAFYALLLRNLDEQAGISAHDVEVTFMETPRHDWLIRGQPGDELDLPYRVEV